MSFFNKKNKNWTDNINEPEEVYDENEQPKKHKAPKFPIQLPKTIGVVLLVAIIAALAFGASYQVGEQEQAIILTFGEPTSVQTSGLHFKIPYVQQVVKIDTTIRGLAIGYDENSTEYIDDESLMITGDYNFVNVDFFVEYKIADPIKALYASSYPEKILKNVCQSSMRTVIGQTDVDDVLTSGKAEIQAKTKELILNKMEKIDIGLQVINISIQDAEPPTQEVMAAFKEVETAKQSKETAINNANKYRNEELPAARAEADKILQSASAEKEKRINEAEGQVARFNSMYEEYVKYPDITRKRMFYETMEDIMPDLKVIIDSGDGTTQKILPLESFNTYDTTQTGGGN